MVLKDRNWAVQRRWHHRARGFSLHACPLPHCGRDVPLHDQACWHMFKDRHWNRATDDLHRTLLACKGRLSSLDAVVSLVEALSKQTSYSEDECMRTSRQATS